MDIKAVLFRVSRLSDLVVSSSWQRLDFNAGNADPSNQNTMPMNSADGKQFLYWDDVNKLIKLSIPNNPLFAFSTTLYIQGTITALIAGMLQFRFVIPNGISAGNNFYFPFPNSLGYANFASMAQFSPFADFKALDIYTNSAMYANGLGVEIRLSSSLVSIITIKEANLIMETLIN